jgi:tetratricopeptide (TPR) repeat protein
LIGRILFAQNKSEEAIIEFRTAIDLDPSVAMHHSNLCFALITLHKYEECRTALKLDSRFALPHSNLGTALLGQGKTDEAITEYKKAIELDPQ